MSGTGLEIAMKGKAACLQEAVRGFGEELWSPEWQALHNAYLEGRQHNTQQYKPGSQELLLLFSDRGGEHVYQFPLYEQLRDVLEPILLQVIALQAAMMDFVSEVDAVGT